MPVSHIWRLGAQEPGFGAADPKPRQQEHSTSLPYPQPSHELCLPYPAPAGLLAASFFSKGHLDTRLRRVFSHRKRKRAVWQYGQVGKKVRREKTVCGLFNFSNPPSAQQRSTWLVNMCPMTDSCQKGKWSVISFMWSITKKSDVIHAMANHPDHQDGILSEKLKLLKTSSFKAEQEQTCVGVL